MSAPVYDVHIAPGKDQSPSGQMKLVAAIAARFRLSAPQVAEGLQAGKYCVGRGVNETTATRLQQQLREMGATVLVEPASAAPAAAPSGRISGSQAAVATPPVSGEPSLTGPPPSSMKGISLAPLTRTDGGSDDIGVMGPLDNAPFVTSSGAGPSPLSRGSSAPKLSPMAAAPPRPAPPVAPRPAAAAPAPAVPAPAPARPSPLPPVASLALDRHPEPPRRAPAPPPPAESPEEPAQRNKIQLDTDNVNVVKCVVHGLFYNKLQSSGCVRCLEVGRKTKQALEERSASARGLSFSSNVRRAFFGLAVALILGFIPAAYYAQRINDKDVFQIRARQGELSKLVATEEIVKEFDTLDNQIEKIRGRGMKVTLTIWIMVSAVVGAAWYRITDS